MLTFGMIRHGRTAWNKEKKIQGRTDVPLSDSGKKQVRSWADTLNHHAFDFILSSPMKRAKQTAGIVGKMLNLDIIVENDLIEQDFGLWEGKTLKQIFAMWPDTEQLMESRGPNFCPPNGESKRSVWERALDVFNKYGDQSPGKRILVVSHNGLMKSVIYPLIKRERLPRDKKILKDYHLHLLSWHTGLTVDKINALGLTKE